MLAFGDWICFSSFVSVFFLQIRLKQIKEKTVETNKQRERGRGRKGREGKKLHYRYRNLLGFWSRLKRLWYSCFFFSSPFFFDTMYKAGVQHKIDSILHISISIIMADNVPCVSPHLVAQKVYYIISCLSHKERNLKKKKESTKVQSFLLQQNI